MSSTAQTTDLEQPWKEHLAKELAARQEQEEAAAAAAEPTESNEDDPAENTIVRPDSPLNAAG